MAAREAASANCFQGQDYTGNQSAIEAIQDAAEQCILEQKALRKNQQSCHLKQRSLILERESHNKSVKPSLDDNKATENPLGVRINALDVQKNFLDVKINALLKESEQLMITPSQLDRDLDNQLELFRVLLVAISSLSKAIVESSNRLRHTDEKSADEQADTRCTVQGITG